MVLVGCFYLVIFATAKMLEVIRSFWIEKKLNFVAFGKMSLSVVLLLIILTLLENNAEYFHYEIQEPNEVGRKSYLRNLESSYELAQVLPFSSTKRERCC